MIDQKQQQENYRKNPIFGTDFHLRLSQIVEQIRNEIMKARGTVNDMQHGSACGERLNNIEGLLNCGLIALYHVKEEIVEWEIKCDDEEHGQSLSFRPRDIGSDECPCCFVCGSGSCGGFMTNLAAFVESKDEGQQIVEWFCNRARLDFRTAEPNWIQVKVGACEQHESALRQIQDIASVHGRIREIEIDVIIKTALHTPAVLTESIQ